jgi:hypothetical protein
MDKHYGNNADRDSSNTDSNAHLLAGRKLVSMDTCDLGVRNLNRLGAVFRLERKALISDARNQTLLFRMICKRYSHALAYTTVFDLGFDLTWIDRFLRRIGEVVAQQDWDQ